MCDFCERILKKSWEARWEAKVRNRRGPEKKKIKQRRKVGGPDGRHKFATAGGAKGQSKHTMPPEPLAQALFGE